MRRPFLVLLAGLLLALVALAAPVAQTAAPQPDPPRVLLDAWDTSAQSTAARIEQGDPDLALIDELRARLVDEMSKMSALSARLDAQLQPLLSQREALGPAPGEGQTEAAEVARERARLNAEIEEFEGLKRRTSQAAARATALMDRLLALRREIFSEKLQERGPSVLEPHTLKAAVTSIIRVAGSIAAETEARIAAQDTGPGLVARIVTPVLVIVAAIVLLRRARRLIEKRLMSRIGPGLSPRRRLAVGTGLVAARLFLPALAVILVVMAALSSGLLGEQGRTLLLGLAVGALTIIGAFALGGAFFSPQAPELRISALGDRDAWAAHRWILTLAAVVGLNWALVQKGRDIGLAVEALTLFNSVLIILGSIALWRLVETIRRGSRPTEPALDEQILHDVDETASGQGAGTDTVLLGILLRLAGLGLRVVAIVAPSLALGGYFAASRFVFYPPVASAALIGFFFLIYSIAREVTDTVFPDGEGTPGATRRLKLIPVAVGFLLAVAAMPLLALLWGAAPVDIVAVWQSFAQGFTIGEFRISPSEFFYFLLVFAIGFVITRVLQGFLRHSVLPLTGLDVGGRDAVVAGVGYVGIFVSALVAISAAGIDLSNLAIVAGALSVGIGFGLQNIVNNFVSGLILLIERPIKAGDWVQIPSGMGYVKQINVRSTEIETFDRSALIVPNSELISSTVTNYTHDNLQGRLIVSVGVAYGSDTRKVEQILLEIARAHPMVLRRPAPWIYFSGFADSALQFEIRAILRDVNWVLNVRSDINHEIARRFAEEGIEIPFPQRDLHLRDPGVLAGALGVGPGDTGGAAQPKRRRRPAPQPGGEADGDADADGR